MSQVIPLGPAARMLTIREAACRLGVPVQTVQLWIEASILPAVHAPGAQQRMPYNAVEALALNMGREPERAPRLAPRAADLTLVQPVLPTPVPAVGARVVLVSSDRQWLRGCKAALEIFGQAVAVWPADSGYMGLLEIGRQQPDLLVTELALPGMDGFDMLRTLERAKAIEGLSVMALSSATQAQWDARGGLPASVEVLPLPISPEALAIRVGRWLLTRHARPGDAVP